MIGAQTTRRYQMYVAGRTQTYFTIPKTIVIFLHNPMVCPVHVETHEWGIDYFCPFRHKKPGKNRILRCNGRQTFLFFTSWFLHTSL